MTEDDTLYTQFLSGDASAYDALMLRHGDGLTRYLFGLLRQWQDAEDLTIEAFARIMVKKPSLRKGGFKAYLYRTARNLAARLHRNRSRAELFSLDETELAETDGLLPEDALRDAEKRRALRVCLERIDPQLREALWLVYFEDLRYAEAAAVMGVSPKRVDHLLTRAKEHMRRELEKEGVTNADK